MVSLQMMPSILLSQEQKPLFLGRIWSSLHSTYGHNTAHPCGFAFNAQVSEVSIFLMEPGVKISQTDYTVLLKNSYCEDQLKLNLRGIVHYSGIRLIFQTDSWLNKKISHCE